MYYLKNGSIPKIAPPFDYCYFSPPNCRPMSKPLRHCSLFIFLFHGIVALAQTNLDSLWQVWKNPDLPDSSRLEALQVFTWNGYLWNNPDSAFYFSGIQEKYAREKGLKKFVGKALNTRGASFSIKNMQDSAIYYYEQSIRYHREAGYQKGVAGVLNNLGNIYYDQGAYEKAVENYQESMHFLQEIGDRKNVALAQSNIGNVYADQGDYGNAIDFFNRALRISESLNDTLGIANAFNNIGIIYNNMSEYKKALEYFKKSLSLYQANSFKHQLAIAHNFNNLGNTSSYLSDDKQALEYYHKALQLYDETGSLYNSANTLNNIGTIYYDQDNYDKALEYFTRCLRIFEEYEDPAGSIIPLNNIGRIAFARGNISKALTYSNKALSIAKKVGNVMGISNASEFLYQVYKQNGNHKKALEIHELYQNTRDSIQSEENQRQVLRQEYQYQYEKKAATDSLKALEEKLVTDTRIATQQMQLEKEKTRRYALYGGVGLLLIFGGVTYNRFRIIRQQKKVIEGQKEKVEKQNVLVKKQNKEIIDSINYARRIQQAILPPPRLVKALLPHSFILYKPKAVVAGDFYWLEQKGDTVLFAAADCTGHGVPGAMVSVICNNGLNRSVREHGLTEPGAILDKTREIVIGEFEKSDEEVKDGMDIALCTLRGNELRYAGAHNPLWLIRNGELIVTKADKQPIGKFDHSRPYTTHVFEVQKGDTIYVFSDGYVDQFGGKESRKFMARSLKKLLLDIQSLEMEEQKAALEVAFEKWRGKEDQIDDVCMIGIRI